MGLSWGEIGVSLDDSGVYWAEAKGIGKLVGLGGEGW